MNQLTTWPAQIYYAIKLFFYKRKIKKKAKRGRNLAPKIANPIAFMQALEQAGISYTVLRWPESISNHPPYVAAGDVDILVDANRNTLAPIIVKHTVNGGIKFDIYSATPKRGTNYRGYSYFPPAMAFSLLANRTKNSKDFYELNGFHYISSLIYHLVYQKGSISGIALRSDQTSESATLSTYGKKLFDAAKQNNVSIPTVLSLEALEAWLVRNQLDMPYDLIIRQCDSSDPWIEFLIARHEQLLKSYFANNNYYFTFMLRDSIVDDDIEQHVLEFLATKFTIAEDIVFPHEAKAAIARKTRGGNWLTEEGDATNLPYRALLCLDNSPEPIAKKNPAHPLIDNEHFYYKFEVRALIETLSKAQKNGIHSGDNLLESAYLWQTIKVLSA
jgi:hypothetical protein